METEQTEQIDLDGEIDWANIPPDEVMNLIAKIEERKAKRSAEEKARIDAEIAEIQSEKNTSQEQDSGLVESNFTLENFLDEMVALLEKGKSVVRDEAMEQYCKSILTYMKKAVMKEHAKKDWRNRL